MVHPQTEPLYGFDGSQAISTGIIAYPVLTDPYNVITHFYMVDLPSPHNIILGRPWLYMMKAVPSTYHQLLRYPVPGGTADIRGDQGISRSCAAIALKRAGWTLRVAEPTNTEPPCKKAKLTELDSDSEED